MLAAGWLQRLHDAMPDLDEERVPEGSAAPRCWAARAPAPLGGGASKVRSCSCAGTARKSWSRPRGGSSGAPASRDRSGWSGSPSSFSGRCRTSTSRARCSARPAFRIRRPMRCRLRPSRSRPRSICSSRSQPKTPPVRPWSRCSRRRTGPSTIHDTRIAVGGEHVAALDRLLQESKFLGGWGSWHVSPGCGDPFGWRLT